MKTLPAKRAKPLLSEIHELILSARQQVAQTVNAGLTMLYWNIGARIRRDVLKEKRAEYGEKIVQALAAKLEAEFGRGFSEKNLRRMVQFADALLSRHCCDNRFGPASTTGSGSRISTEMYCRRVSRWSHAVLC